MDLWEPRRQNKQGAVAGGRAEGVTPFFGPAALRCRRYLMSPVVITKHLFALTQMKELPDVQAATHEKLHILIDTVDRFIRRDGKTGGESTA
jgi:hypothetical protein